MTKNGIGPLMSWPVALTKQVEVKSMLGKDELQYIFSYAATDLSLEINTRFDWNFNSSNPNPDAHDFSRIIITNTVILAVELTKALGFASTFQRYNVKSDLKLVTPKLHNDDPEWKRESSPPTYYRMRYITPFDGMVYSKPSKSRLRRLLGTKPNGQDSLAQLTLSMEDFQNPIYHIKDPNLLLRDSKFTDSAKRITDFFNSTTLEVRLPGRVSLPLASYYIGRTNPNYFSTTEFLMTPNTSTTAGIGLLNMMDKFGMKGIYGPRTLKVLQEIGWSTLQKPQTIELSVPEESQSDWL